MKFIENFLQAFLIITVMISLLILSVVVANLVHHYFGLDGDIGIILVGCIVASAICATVT